MKTNSQRTQIYLPKDLREEIDKQRQETGESLAEFLRKAAEEKIAKNKKKKVDLKKLADEFIGSSKRGKGGWGDIENTYEYIRKMRQEEDEHWMQRWKEAVKKPQPHKKTPNNPIMVVQDAQSIKKKRK